jgi:hypothetical protein
MRVLALTLGALCLDLSRNSGRVKQGQELDA